MGHIHVSLGKWTLIEHSLLNYLSVLFIGFKYPFRYVKNSVLMTVKCYLWAIDNHIITFMGCGYS